MAISIRIKTPDGSEKSVSILHPVTATAYDLKRLVLLQFPGDDDRDVRLIFAGKLLAPPHARICSSLSNSSSSEAATSPGPNFNIRDGAVVHAVITAKKSSYSGGGPGVPSSSSSSQLSSAAFPPPPSQLSLSSSSPAATTSPTSSSLSTAAATGFDLLRSPATLLELFPELSMSRGMRMRDPRTIRGLSQGEVDSIRAYFLPSVRLSHSLSSWTSPDLEQEQQWMRQQMRQADSEFTLNVWQPMLSADLTSPSSADSSGPRSGSSEGPGGPMDDDTESGLAARLGLGSGSRPASGGEEFMCGLCMGYFLGSLMLFCAWDRHVTFSQRMGIFSGILLHLIFALLSAPSSTSPSPSTSTSSSSSSVAAVSGFGPGVEGSSGSSSIGNAAAYAPVTVTVG